MDAGLFSLWKNHNRRVLIEGGDSGSFSKSYVCPYRLPIHSDTTRIISTYTFDLVYETLDGKLSSPSNKQLVEQHFDFVPYPLERPVSIIVSDGRIFTDKKFLESSELRYNTRLKMFLKEIQYTEHSFNKLYKTAGGVYA